MTRRRKISKLSLYALANLEALNRYREAFRTGQLGRGHGAVVRSVYGLAADELYARATRALYVALGWLVLGIGLFLVAGGDRGSPWYVGAVLAGALSGRYAGAMLAYRDAARLLAPPPLAEAAEHSQHDSYNPDQPIPNGKYCGHTWRAPSSMHDHTCISVGYHLAGKHQCGCGFAVSLPEPVELEP